jgi:phosphoglycolate phosphatase
MPHARPIVVLFDIDGTLLETGGAGRAAMEAAFGEICGRPDACGHFSFGGMTDRAIARQGLEAAGESPDEARLDALVASYLRHLADALPRHPHRVLPGVPPLLAALAVREDVALGLGTGNVREGAFAKLRHAAIDAPFRFGGFGCDAEDRAELLRVGAERGAAMTGRPREACRVVVIGDTPRDVAAAHAIGAEIVAVATGGYDVEALRATGAARVLPDLEGFAL